MAEWSMELPLCLQAVSHYCPAQVWISAGLCEKVASDLGLGMVFARTTTVSSTTYNWLVKIEIPNSKWF